MSYEGLLTQRATVKRLNTVMTDGAPSSSWQQVAGGVPCRVDLSPMTEASWRRESGRPADRAGKAFFLVNAPIKPGDHIVLGTFGTFELTSQLNPVMGLGPDIDHIEVQVEEVARPLGNT